MTIEHENYRGTKDFITVFCAPKTSKQPGCHPHGKHLTWIEHDPKDEPYPMTDAEIAIAEQLALDHDEDCPNHLIRVICYSRLT